MGREKRVACVYRNTEYIGRVSRWRWREKGTLVVMID